MLWWILGPAGGLVVVGGGAFAAYAWNNTTYTERDAGSVRDAEFAEHRVTLPSGTDLNYAEGPDHGPPVLLVHGQASAWESYSRALPELADRYHVFAIDVAGHGDSARTPGRYDIHTIGADVVAFVEQVIGEPVILSGHSSGGLIAAWVAAEAPDNTAAVLFEDPPFFSTDPDRFEDQFNYVDLARPAHEFLQRSAETDFASWYIAHNGWIGHFGGGRDSIVRHAQRQREKHPDRPLNLWFFPPSINESFAHMHEFDPRFADAFYNLEWQVTFDQSDVLSRVRAPSILVHAKWRISNAGILEGAMTDDDAARACALAADCQLERVDTGHGFHFQNPDRFVALIDELAGRSPATPTPT